MSVYVLLSLLNELRKSDKMRGLPRNMNRSQDAEGTGRCFV